MHRRQPDSVGTWPDPAGAPSSATDRFFLEKARPVRARVHVAGLVHVASLGPHCVLVVELSSGLWSARFGRTLIWIVPAWPLAGLVHAGSACFAAHARLARCFLARWF